MYDIGSILTNWNLSKPYKIHKITDNVCNINDDYILKTGSDVYKLENHIETSRALALDGVPVSLPVKTLSNQDYIILNNTFYYLSDRLPGSPITEFFEGDYCSRAYMLGQLIARLHKSFQNVKGKIHCKDNDMVLELTDSILPMIRSHKEYDFDEAAIETSFEPFKGLYSQLPRQIIHRDMHCGNLLFDDGRWTGCIDCDQTQINARIFDVCYMGRSILVECFDDMPTRDKWAGLFGCILSGYDSINELTQEEIKILPHMLCCIELLFIAYFIEIEHPEFCKTSVDIFDWQYKNREELYREYAIMGK